MLYGNEPHQYEPAPHKVQSTTSGISATESGRTSLESNPAEYEEFDNDWFDGIILPSAEFDFDLSRCGSYAQAISHLARLKTQILSRTSSMVVKVPRRFVFELAKYANRPGWKGGCESSLDALIFKAPQSPLKGEISLVLAADLQASRPPGSLCSLDAILPIAGQTKAPDIVFWRNSPTSQQKLHPLAEASLCPLPNLWIELFVNVTNDRDKALIKIRDVVIPNCGETCAVLAMGIPSSITEAMLQRIHKNEPLSDPTLPAAMEEGRPWASPYVGYWPLGTAFEDGRWFPIRKNRHLEVMITNDFMFRLEFNSIIECL